MLKHEVKSLKAGANFQNKWFEEANRDLEETVARNPIAEDIKMIEQKHQYITKQFGE